MSAELSVAFSFVLLLPFCRTTDSEQTDPLGHGTLLLHNDTTRKVEKRGNSGSNLPTLSILKETARLPMVNAVCSIIVLLVKRFVLKCCLDIKMKIRVQLEM